MGSGFLGTPASLMLDVVICSLIIIVPALIASIYLVKWRRDYLRHKWIQIVISCALILIVGLFEIDMQLQGGFWVMAKDSPYAQTAFLHNLLYIHLVFSISTVVLWLTTFVTALRYVPNPPAPSRFSRKHKFLAWISVGDLVATVVTGLMVYYYGFWVTGR